MTTGFEYGNTRLRAMRTRLMAGAAYERLLIASTIDQLIGALGDTEYASDLDAAVTRYVGVERLNRALSAHLGRTLTAIRGFYSGDAAHHLDLLLAHYDADNLIAILRAQAAPPGTEPATPALVSAGALDLSTLEELISCDGLRATIDLMAAWGLPTPAAAPALRDALGVFNQTGDLTHIEIAVATGYARRVMAEAPDIPQSLLNELAARIDATNLLAALRLAGARRHGATATEGVAFLPGGKLDGELLDRITTAVPSDVVGLIATVSTPPGWDDALQQWEEDDRLDMLADELDAVRHRRAVSLFASGDPLGIDIPIAYVAAKEIEVRNLRLIGGAVIHRIPSAIVAQRLVTA